MKKFNETIYRNFQIGIKKQIRVSQSHAIIAANSEMILLFWQIGRDIIERQARFDSESEFVNQLASDLQAAFPEMREFTPSNLMYMKVFAETWTDSKFVQQVVAQLPWGHIVCIIEEVSEHDVRNWYVKTAIDSGWSLVMLRQKIEAKAHLR